MGGTFFNLTISHSFLSSGWKFIKRINRKEKEEQMGIKNEVGEPSQPLELELD